MSRRFLLVGLTGGLATGKSTVSDMLRARGCVVLDADVLAREVVEPGQPALATIAREFGADVLRPDGTLDRKRLGAIVFADTERRRRLEAITHPAIRDRYLARLAELQAQGFDGVVVWDAPVMIESGGYKHVDRLVVVVTDDATQRERALARDGDRADVERKIASQMPLADKAALADYVIDNSGDRVATQAQVEKIHGVLVREAEISRRLLGRAMPLSALFPIGMGIYGRNRVDVRDAFARLKAASPRFCVVAHHWRPSGNFVFADPGSDGMSHAIEAAEAVLALKAVGRRFSQLRQLVWQWPTQWQTRLAPLPGRDVRVAVMLSGGVPPEGRVAGVIRDRIEIVRWVTDADVLCLYRRPEKNGSLGHVSAAILRAVLPATPLRCAAASWSACSPKRR